MYFVGCSWEPIVNYIERKYLDYFSEETKIERAATIPDKRVHLCLYFVSPTGHGYVFQWICVGELLKNCEVVMELYHHT